MRTTLEIGALGLIIYRGVKRALRKSDTQTRKQAPTGAHEGDATGSD
jgi:hypothetical protein